VDAVLTAVLSQGPSELACSFYEFQPNLKGIVTLCSDVPVTRDVPATCNAPGRATPGSYAFLVGCPGANSTIDVERVVPTLELTGDGTATTGGSQIITARAFLPGSPEVALGGYPVTFTITSGSGSLSPLSTATAAAEGSMPTVVARANTLTVTTLPNGIAQALVSSNQGGVVAVGASLQVGSASIAAASGASISFAPGQVAVVTLSPHMVETDCEKPVALTATTLTAAVRGSPVVGVRICLFPSGKAKLRYYHARPHPEDPPPVTKLCGVTDAQGRFTATFTSVHPGPVAIVAAALSDEALGSTLLAPVSEPSHVMFWGHEKDRGWWR